MDIKDISFPSGKKETFFLTHFSGSSESSELSLNRQGNEQFNL